MSQKTTTEVQQLDKEKKEELKAKIKALTDERSSIIDVASYLQCYRHLARPLVEQISRSYEAEQKKHRLLLYFFVANEAIFRTKDDRRLPQEEAFVFVKAFGDKMLQWIDIFINQVDDFSSLDQAYKVIQLWEDELIFAKTFCQLMKSYVRPKLDSARQKQAQMPSGLGGMDPHAQRKQQEERLKKQLKTLNQFPVCRQAVQLDLQIQKLRMAQRLKDLTQRVDDLSKNPKASIEERDMIKSALFQMKREQQEVVVMGGFGLMYQLSKVVNSQKEDYMSLLQKKVDKTNK